MTKHKPLISAVINVRNEAENLEKCLKSIKNLVDEIVIVDMHSTDNSIEIAKKYGAKIFYYRFLKVVEPARNYALSKATGKWILLLDPDEYLGKSLKKELSYITKRTDVDYVKIPRKNIILGKWIRHCRCYPDYLIRFFKKGAVVWQKEIHSQPITKGNGLTLLDCEKLSIRHNNYPSVNCFIQRALRYASIQAEELKSTDYKIKTSDFFLRPVQEFNSRFFLAEGFRDGWHGLIFCILQAIQVALVYIKLWEKQGNQDKVLSKESFVSGSLETSFEYSYWFTRYFSTEYTKNILKIILIKIKYFFDRLCKQL